MMFSNNPIDLFLKNILRIIIITDINIILRNIVYDRKHGTILCNEFSHEF